MSEENEVPGSRAATRPRREVWPVELRLLHQALADGLLSEEWLTDVLRRGPYDDGAEVAGVGPGEGPEGTGRMAPEEVERWCEILLDRDRRTAAFDGLALSHGVGMAARYVLLEVGDTSPSRVTAVLAVGVADGQVAITGALRLLGELARDDEVMAVGLMEELFEELSERGAGVLGLKDHPGFTDEVIPEDNGANGEET